MQYEKKWQPFRGRTPKPTKKCRLIRYAARSDAYIFMRYRHLLAEKYEAQLSTLGLADCVLAYRKIPVGNGRRSGKCNIHFAKDAFERISQLGDCCAVAADISNYFENLDHRRLRAVWRRLIDEAELPRDYYAVFKAITRYSVVDRKDAYTRLGFFGEKRRTVSGKPIMGFLRPVKKMPTRLCSLHDFRAKICGRDPSLPNLVKVNGRDLGKPRTGIPQGSPSPTSWPISI